MAGTSRTLVCAVFSLAAISLYGAGCSDESSSSQDAARDSAKLDQGGATDFPNDAFLAIDSSPGADAGSPEKDSSLLPDVPQIDGPAVSPVDLAVESPVDASSKPDTTVVLDGSADTGTVKLLDATVVDGSVDTGTVDLPSDAPTLSDVPAESEAGGGEVASGPPTKVGIISLMQALPPPNPPAGTVYASGAVASFSLVTLDTSCTPTVSGDCQLSECPSSLDAGTQTLTKLQAGTVTITGLATDLSLAYYPQMNGYMSSSITTPLWTASRTATLTVSGSADVPAFSASLVVPNPISVTSPAPSGAMAYTLSRTSSLTVSWTGGVDGTATLNLSSDNGVAIACSVDAAKGTLTVPAAFMAKLSSTGSFAMGTGSMMTKNVGDWLMQFQALTTRDQGTMTAATFTE